MLLFILQLITNNRSSKQGNIIMWL